MENTNYISKDTNKNFSKYSNDQFLPLSIKNIYKNEKENLHHIHIIICFI